MHSITFIHEERTWFGWKRKELFERSLPANWGEMDESFFCMIAKHFFGGTKGDDFVIEWAKLPKKVANGLKRYVVLDIIALISPLFERPVSNTVFINEVKIKQKDKVLLFEKINGSMSDMSFAQFAGNINYRDAGSLGLSSGCRNNETLLELYKKSLLFSKNIAVEKHFEGVGHRITIYDKKILTVTKKLPFGITGDGISNIDSLIKDKDDEAIGLIKQYNLELNTVLEKGEFIPLKRRNNASAGGTTIGLDIDLVHQDNITLCLKVADIFSLNMVGVDLIIPDISKSWMEVGCLVCDVNGIPQIGYEHVAKPIIEDLFKLGSRVPAYLLIVNSLENLDISTIVSITKCDGISSANGIWVNNKLISNNFNNGFEAAIALLFDRNINRALCILTDKGILQFGLPLDKFDGIFIQKDILQIEMVSQILKNSKNIIEI